MLEDLIKFGNLNDTLRKNLWMNVSPVIIVQSKYRRKLNIGSVFCNVYTKILEHSKKAFHSKVQETHEMVEAYKQTKEYLDYYDAEDFEALKNIVLAITSLFPENKCSHISIFNSVFQGCRDEEMTFWILVCILENKEVSLLIH